MKPNLLTTFLAGAFVLMAVCAFGFAGWYAISWRQLQKTHAKFMAANNNQAVLRTLVAEAFEYRKRNPAIEPILRSANLVPAGLAPTNAPAGAPIK